MVRAFAFLAGLPALPFRPTDRIDIVPVDFVAGAVAMLHQKANPAHDIYHLSSGVDSETFSDLTESLARAQGKRPPIFVPELEGPSAKMVNVLAGSAGKVGGIATLLKVFLPYLVWNTVFDNSRAVAEMGRRPAPFSKYCYPLLRFTRENNFAYKYRGWPSGAAAQDTR
jgi:nucleoside-diphosphate-sugar epimerase